MVRSLSARGTANCTPLGCSPALQNGDTFLGTLQFCCRSTLRLFNASTILIDLGPHFLSFSAIMRLLVEILVVATVIYFGWNKPYKEYAARANKTITSKLDGLGGTRQKHKDSSVKRY